MSLDQGAADTADVRMTVEPLGGMVNPAGTELAVAVDELHVLELREAREQRFEARVARARGREARTRIELDDSQVTCEVEVVVGSSCANRAEGPFAEQVAT